MDAIRLLKEDHQKVRRLLEELAATTERAVKKREELLHKIAKELELHTAAEERVFYPAFRQADGKEHERMVAEALEEHRAVDELVLPDLLKTEVGGVSFSGRAKVLKELVEHHADEEEKELFPKARKALGKEELLELGEQMTDLKRSLETER